MYLFRRRPAESLIRMACSLATKFFSTDGQRKKRKKRRENGDDPKRRRRRDG